MCRPATLKPASRRHQSSGIRCSCSCILSQSTGVRVFDKAPARVEVRPAHGPAAAASRHLNLCPRPSQTFCEGSGLWYEAAMTKTRRACRLVFSLAWAWRPGAPQAFRQSFPVHGGLKVHSKLCGLACRLMRDLWPTRVLASCAVPFDVESLSPCRGVHTFMPTCFALHSCHVSVRLHACA